MRKPPKIGAKVKMSPTLIRWNLSHDHYQCCKLSTQENVDPNADYHEHIQLTLLALMGEPVTGTVIKAGSEGCMGIEWRLGRLKYFEYNEPDQLIAI